MSSLIETAFPRVLHIRRSDEAESYILLHVTHSNSTDFPLNITATEGESPYTATGKWLLACSMLNRDTHT